MHHARKAGGLELPVVEIVDVDGPDALDARQAAGGVRAERTRWGVRAPRAICARRGAEPDGVRGDGGALRTRGDGERVRRGCGGSAEAYGCVRLQRCGGSWLFMRGAVGRAATLLDGSELGARCGCGREADADAVGRGSSGR